MLITLFPLLLGLAAWTLGLIRIWSQQHRALLGSLSWCCCACSLWFPLHAIWRWAENEDIAAILDCTHAYLLCATVLLIGNALLFLIAAFVKRK